MNFEESAKKLYTLPWQALYDLAVEKQIDGEEIKHKEKTEIIRRVLLSDITEAKMKQLSMITPMEIVLPSHFGDFQKLYL